MCGITGYYNVKGIVQEIINLKDANDIVSHRGPDGSGFAFFDTRIPQRAKLVCKDRFPQAGEIGSATLGFGHRRLAIIDLTDTGFQPMTCDDGMLWITYNGEVYNYIELRAELEKRGHTFRSSSDTEVILHAYQEWGDDCVNHFNGMWAFALADLQTRRVFCSRDRFGVKPFQYYFDGEHFIFASEIKQILVFPVAPKRVNKRAVYEYLAYGAVEHYEETFFEGIHHLMPGHTLNFDLNTHTLQIKKFYQPQLEINRSITLNEAALEFRRLLTDSVRLRLRSDVEVGSCLSGGLDSSSIVCLMRRLLDEEGKTDIQHTFSSHFEEEEANEIEYMQEIIRTAGVREHFIHPTPEEFLKEMGSIVWHQDEPFGSTSVFAQWSVFKLTHEHGIKVMLDGQGADEMLGGYIGYVLTMLQELRAKRKVLSLAWETWQIGRLHGRALPPLAKKGWINRIMRLIGFRSESAPYPPTDWIDPSLVEKYSIQSPFFANQQIKPYDELELLNNTLYQHTFVNNLQQLLKNEDRDSMAFSVESRLPFLDYRLVEFIFSLPSDFKIRDGLTKRVLRESMRGVIPEKIRRRVSKLGFATPETTWQRTILRPLIEQAINDEALRGFILPEKARGYHDYITQHNLRDFTAWRWLNLSLWLKTYHLSTGI
ncbi:MAG: asparagine synthase (glutamine-hydrolyzing) [Anaerolineales bacterium]|nr:asparagine synthase (glutamine-hydrolyzing) [Anaerolineales bacterium]